MSPGKGTRIKLMNDSCDHMSTGAVAGWKGPGKLETHPLSCHVFSLSKKNRKVQDFFCENSIISLNAGNCFDINHHMRQTIYQWAAVCHE